MNNEQTEVEEAEFDAECEKLYASLAAEIQPVFEKNGWKWAFVEEYRIPDVSDMARTIGMLHRDVMTTQSATGRLFARRKQSPIEFGYKDGDIFVVVKTV